MKTPHQFPLCLKPATWNRSACSASRFAVIGLNFVLVLLSTPFFAHADSDGAAPVRVACVGDSITEGTVLKDRGRTSYPAVLAGLLGDSYQVRNFGRSGATVTALGEGAKPYASLPEASASLAWEPQIVVIMLGTNDTKTSVFEAGGSTFRERYQELLDSYRSLKSPPRILICLPVPVMGEGRFTINEANRQKLLPIIDAIARDHGLELIDLDPLLAPRSDLFPDLVHPNEEATAKIARAVAEKIQKPNTP